MRKIVVGVILVLLAWDFFTTYFGTVSIFNAGDGVADTLAKNDIFVHLGALIFALGLDVFIVSYKIILRADNNITKGTLFVAFIYDFATSAYGTAQAMGGGADSVAQLAIVILFALMTTGAPLLITQVMED